MAKGVPRSDEREDEEEQCARAARSQCEVRRVYAATNSNEVGFIKNVHNTTY